MLNEVFIRNHKLTYQIHSSGKEKIILLHGWSSFQFFWSHLIDYFKPFGECITVDLMGHYPATVPENFGEFTMDELIDIQAEAIREILKDEPCTLIGHSAGGFVALGIAGKYPELVKKLIVICPAIHGPVVGLLYPLKVGYQLKLGGFISELQKLLLIPEFSMQMFFNLAVHDKKKFFENEKNQEFLKTYHKRFQEIDSSIMGNYLLMVDKSDVVPYAKKITIPIQLHVGMNDFIVPTKFGIMLSEILQNVELQKYENSGHVPSLEEKDLFLTNTLNFLKNN